MDRESSVWTYFTKKSGFVATCNTCQQDYSFRASTSNLRKHWNNKHGKDNGKSSDISDRNCCQYDSDEEQEKQSTQKKPTWNFFEVLDSDKFEATCKICNRVVSYDSIADLKQHVQDHGEVPNDSDDDFVPEVQEPTLKRKYKSSLWKFFNPTDEKMAVCLLCRKLFNYGSTITNLRRHLARKHGHAPTLSQDDTANTILIDEQLNEARSGQEDNDVDEEPMEMNAIYLDSNIEDSLDKPPTPSPMNKRPMKRNFSKIKERVHIRTSDTSSEELELPRKPISSHSPKTRGSLDYFGQYVVSLLKEMPKQVSDQLQSEIIKQILNSKMALESQYSQAVPVVAKYEIKRCRNNENVAFVPEPVSYTVVQTNEATESVNETTECIIQE